MAEGGQHGTASLGVDEAKEIHLQQRRALALSRTSDAERMRVSGERRRQMQRERKEAFAELRPDASRPWSSEQFLTVVERANRMGQRQHAVGFLADGEAGTSTSAVSDAGAKLSEQDGGLDEESLDAEIIADGGSSPSRARGTVFGSSRTAVRKVDWFHRSMVRREVWRQKFAFLYGRMQEECLEEFALSKLHGRDVAAAGEASHTSPTVSPAGTAAPVVADAAASGNHSPATTSGTGTPYSLHEEGTLPPAIDATAATAPESEEQRSGQRPLSRGSSIAATSTRTAAVGAAAAQELLRLQLEASEVRGLRSSADVEESSAPLVRQKSEPGKAGWRRTRSQTSSVLSGGACASRPGHAAANQLAASTRPGASSGRSGAAKKTTGRSESAPRLHGTSSSSTATSKAQPHWAAPRALVAPLVQDLQQARDEYYGGDELFLHQDILHSANPRLFPLRTGLGQKAPPSPRRLLQSLAVPFPTPRKGTGSSSRGSSRGRVVSSASAGRRCS